MRRVKDRLKAWDYEYRGWDIYRRGGFSMMRHFSAYKGERFFCRFKLKDLRETLDRAESNPDMPNGRSPYL